MTASYMLYVQTEIPVEATLQLMFEPKSIAPIEGTDLLYARGMVFLAHGQPLPLQMQDRYHNQFGFAPNISIRYFPDGVSAVKTAMTMLAEGIMRWLNGSDSNLVLVENDKLEVMKRLDGNVTLYTTHDFWAHDRLKLVDLPYSELPS